MDQDAAAGATALALLVLGAWVWQRIGGYNRQVCPTCNGDGREFAKGSGTIFRVCTQCGGNKAVPR